MDETQVPSALNGFILKLSVQLELDISCNGRKWSKHNDVFPSKNPID